MEETAKRNPRRRGAMLPWAVAGLSTAIALLAIALAWRQSARADAGNAAGTDPALQQEIANLRQSDRISRQAVLALQDTLTERDEQVAALRADLDFYERFVSPDVQRRGLSVHAAHVEAQAPGVWRYELTLTQGREQPGASQGTLTLLYSQWIPGQHSPSGPIDKMAGFVFTANGKRLKFYQALALKK